MNVEESELLTRTGPGTPCGELMRRYWQPVALAEEVPPGGAPLPIRILSEDLVLFRDPDDRIGLLGLHCAHRGADLSYGRVEDGGLRCIYHGWLYDVEGRVLDMPGEPGGGTPECRAGIRQTAYPCTVRNGTVFAYMGPGEAPCFPNYEFLSAPEDHGFSIKLHHACNFLQANEGNIDLSHLTFLHYTRFNRGIGGRVGSRPLPTQNAVSGRSAAGTEEFDVELTQHGLRSYKVRRDMAEKQYHLYITQFVLPNFTTFPGTFRGWCGYGVNWHVPIDDTHHWKFTFEFRRDEPIDKEKIRNSRAGMTPDYRALIGKENRYRQDRDLMVQESYTGIGKTTAGHYNFQVQDLWATEGQGLVQDRTEEHLVPSDRAVLAARKVLFGAIRDLQEGREPRNVIRDSEANEFRLVTLNEVIPDSKPWRERARELEGDVVFGIGQQAANP